MAALVCWFTFITVKCTSSMVQSVSALENTEAWPKLVDNAIAILKLVPMFKAVSLTSPGLIVKWCEEKSFTDVIKKVLLEGEARERRAAKEKGAAAGAKEGAAVSRGGADDACAAWAKIKTHSGPI